VSLEAPGLAAMGVDVTEVGIALEECAAVAPYEVVDRFAASGGRIGGCCCTEDVYFFSIRDPGKDGKTWRVGPKTTQAFHHLHYELKQLQRSGAIEKPLPDLPTNGVWDIPCTEGTQQMGLPRTTVDEFAEYLGAILAHDEVARHPTVEQFIEVSSTSFNDDLGPKMREGWAYMTSSAGCVNRTIDAFAGSGLAEACNCACTVMLCLLTGPCGICFGGMCSHCCARTCCTIGRQDRWFVLKPSYIAYYEHPEDEKPRGVLLFGRDSKVEQVYACCCLPTGWRRVYGSGRTLKIRASHSAVTEAWARGIEEALEEGGAFQGPSAANRGLSTQDAMADSAALAEPHLVATSFAARHDNVTTKWFVDGWQYYESVLAALESAQREILIAGWMLSPEVILQRRSCRDDVLGIAEPSTSLLHVLKRKCEEGIQVRVMVYAEIPGTVPVDSAHAEAVLGNLHPNLQLIRHPGIEHVAGTMLMWSHHEKVVCIDQCIAFCGGIDLAFGRCDSKDHRLNDVQCGSWLGKDYYNPNLGGFQDLEHPDTDDPSLQGGRRASPRMPWHDIHMALLGKPALDIARHFAGRWNKHLLEGFMGNQERPSNHTAMTPLLLLAKQPQPPAGGWNPPWENNEHRCSVQVLRSAAWWSAGLDETEHSILDAYIEMIELAEHSIYIENQFFISSTGNVDAEKHKIVKNDIVAALAKKIAEKIAEDQGGPPSFRCYVVLPNYPEGNLDEVPVQVVLHWEQQTICRAARSLFAQLKEAAQQVGDLRGSGAGSYEELVASYVHFGCLRSVDALGGHPVCEQIYVHSKLLIVDDRYVIIGSANINDRSQLGYRDSEICCLVQPQPDDEGSWVNTMANGKPYRAGSYAHSLRMFCMAEHLGLPSTDPQVADPAAEATWGLWTGTASSNTALIATVFPSQPRDEIKTLAQMKRLKALEDEEMRSHTRLPLATLSKDNPDDQGLPHKATARPQAWKGLAGLRGHLVDFPLQFLSQETLNPSAGEYEFVAKVFT